MHLRLGLAPEAAQAAGQAVHILSRALPEGHVVTAIGRCLLGEALLPGPDGARGKALIAAALPVVDKAGSEHAQYAARCRAAAAGVTPQPQR